MFKPVLRIRNILASWIRIWIQGEKYQQKPVKKNLLSKLKSELFKKERLFKFSLSLNGLLSLSIKISEKKKH